MDERCFVLFSDLRLTEINLQSKQVVQSVLITQLEGAGEQVTDTEALAFAMFKELNMIAISTESAVHIVDYESSTMKFVRKIEHKNVKHICFVETYIVLVLADEDSDDAVLICYELVENEPLGQIKIKQYMGQKVNVLPSE